MPIKIYKTNRSARKQASIVDRSELHRGRPHKQLTASRKRTSGRGSLGKITVRHRGGGAKRMQRLIDYGQTKEGIEAKVERLEYDPNHSAWLALLLYADGERRYVLSWAGAKTGDKVVAKKDAPEQPGNRLTLSNITPGATVYNVEFQPGRGGKLFRAAGAYATVMDVQDKFALLKLPSGESRLVPVGVWANYGMVGNADHRLVRQGSAGRMRRRGRRPQVRGKVMNPVDHPHGGGEGAQPIGMTHPKTKWGKPALGVKTRSKGKYSDKYIVQRRKKKNK
jgi:large subunit ribosomal protein L2